MPKLRSRRNSEYEPFSIFYQMQAAHRRIWEHDMKIHSEV